MANQRCQQAIEPKNAAEGSSQFEEKRKECAQTLKEEYQAHVASLKRKLAGLPKGSKAWWRTNKELLEKKCKLSSIPPLRQNDQWISSSKEKANAFANTFQEKDVLPEEFVDTPLVYQIQKWIILLHPALATHSNCSKA